MGNQLTSSSGLRLTNWKSEPLFVHYISQPISVSTGSPVHISNNQITIFFFFGPSSFTGRSRIEGRGGVNLSYAIDKPLTDHERCQICFASLALLFLLESLP